MFDDEMMDAFVEETRDYYDEEFLQEFEEFHSGDYDCEDWDSLELGFNPYMGCYDYDC